MGGLISKVDKQKGQPLSTEKEKKKEGGNNRLDGLVKH
jgi:hypothetical protein